MVLSLRKRFYTCAVVALTAIISLTGNPVSFADNGYVMPDGKTPFYRVPGQNKSVRLIMSAYPFPDATDAEAKSDSGTAKNRATEKPKPQTPKTRKPSDAIRDALRDATIEDSDAMSFSDLDAEEKKDYDDAPLFEMNKDRLARVENGRFVLPPLLASSVKTDSVGNGRIPQSFRDMRSDPPRLLPESGAERYLDEKPWNWTVGHWAAANTYSFPRYFEDRMLERHGHERHPKLTPIASGLRFAATVPMLPYLMTLSPPSECESTLGFFRSGSCAPVMHQQPPYSNRALMVEAASLAAGIVILP